MAADNKDSTTTTLSQQIRVHLRFSGARASVLTMELHDWVRRAADLEATVERLTDELARLTAAPPAPGRN